MSEHTWTLSAEDSLPQRARKLVEIVYVNTSAPQYVLDAAAFRVCDALEKYQWADREAASAAEVQQ